MAYTSQRLPLPRDDNGVPLRRADLVFDGVDHSGPSFEGRIFLNAPRATIATPRELGSGYAGSLYVFGHSHCWGDPGHCDVPPGPLHGYDLRPPHQLVPQRHAVDVTEAIERQLEGRTRSFTVTVVPVVRDEGKPRLDNGVLSFERLRLVTYD